MTFVPLSLLLQKRRPDDHPVALRNGVPIPFSTFSRDVRSIAARFQGRRVALICSDSYHYAAGLFGLLHGGAEIILPPNTLPATMQALKQDFDCIVDDASVAAEGDYSLPAYDAARPALHFFTSGSTGVAKKVTKSLSMFEAESAAIHSLWGGASVVFSSVPHHHVYGSSFKIFWPLAAGIPFDCAASTPLDQLKPHSILVSSPAHLNRLSALSPVPLARVFCAGAPLPFAAAQEAKRIFGCLPTEIFGSTETGAIATREQKSSDTLWTPLPGVSVECTQEGRMSLLSPFVGQERIVMEDRIECTPQGFHFLGRADDIVKIEGRRVSLLHVEKELCALPFVAEAAAVLLEESRLGAALVLTQEGSMRLNELGAFRFGRAIREALSGSLEAAAMPRRWRFVEALPVQAMGKRKISDIIALFKAVQE